MELRTGKATNGRSQTVLEGILVKPKFLKNSTLCESDITRRLDVVQFTCNIKLEQADKKSLKSIVDYESYL